MKKLILLGLVLIPTITSASIDVNLKYGATGPEVIELQEFLLEKGFLNSTPTGNFYSLTNSAVTKYQASVGLPTTGFVGPMTRAKINTELGTKIDSANNQEISETGSVSTAPKTDQLSQLLNQVKALQELIAKQNQTQQSTLTSIQQIQQNTTPTPAPIYIPPTPQLKTPIKFSLQSVMGECLNGPSGPNLDKYSTSPDVLKVESDTPVKGKIIFTLTTDNKYGQGTLVVGSDRFEGISGQYSLDSKNDLSLYFGADRKSIPLKIEDAKSSIKVKVTIDSFQPEDGRAVEGLPLNFPEVQTKICN